MRFPLLPVIILLLINLGIDYYIYKALEERCKRKIWSKIQLWTALAFAITFIAVIALPKRGGSDSLFDVVLWTLFAYLTIYIPKIIFVFFDYIAKLPRVVKKPRWKAVSWIGAGAGVIVFVLCWWGALCGRFITQINDVDIEVANLPAAFDGFTIAQISDLHVGTFGGRTGYVKDLVEQINDLKPDVIVFTGDIVNRHSAELKPFAEALSKLNAKYGVYSVMGNHDYGDYSSWSSPQDKENDVLSLKAMEEAMGWKMLNNETDWIRIDSDSIALIGVENVGDPPFKTYGNLHEAYPAIDDANVKILLTHNPAHWVSDIKDNEHSNVALTLSGHTHAMQIELFGFSPAKWRYATWGGLYVDSLGHNLYVNIGAGEVGFPARIGANPEITVLTLKPQNHRD